MERYAIRGGEAGYRRLQVLSRERWPDTAAVLARAGLKPRRKVVDLGCGSGDVTMEIAQMVAPGPVLGIDMDAEKLELARKTAEARGLANVSFRVLNIHDWNEPFAYDMVYTRFVLQHVREPVAVLRNMWQSVRGGGCLVVEDADLDSWASDPDSRGLALFQKWYAELLPRWGGTPAIGRKLPVLFKSARIPVTSIEVTQRFYSGEAKRLPWSTLEATADGIISEGIATKDEVDAALADLEHLAEDPDSLILAPRLVQVIAQRPS
jgi:ubiquinone/menaquinone biosynthesis C-methylase UbiE